MGIMGIFLITIWVMQDLYHQSYELISPNLSLPRRASLKLLLASSVSLKLADLSCRPVRASLLDCHASSVLSSVEA